MKIDWTDGVLIEGTPEELLDLADDLRTAVEEGAVESAVVSLDEGVTPIRIRVTEESAT